MNDDVHIFRSEPDEAVTRLAQLDSKRPPDGPVLAVAVAGQIRAALPLDGGPALADPFHPTAALVSLLELHLAQRRGAVPRWSGTLLQRAGGMIRTIRSSSSVGAPRPSRFEVRA